MEIKEVEGFVLNESNYGETSKILNIFTKELGTISLLSKGCKKGNACTDKRRTNTICSVFT